MRDLYKLINEALHHDISSEDFKQSPDENYALSNAASMRVNTTYNEEHNKLSSYQPIPNAAAHEAIDYYCCHGSGAINRHMREGTMQDAPWHVKTHTDNINSFLKKSISLKDEHHVYSGISGYFNPASIFAEHDGVFKNTSFISSSLNPLIASSHAAKEHYSLGDQHIIHFHLPVGFKGGAYVGHVSPFPTETEMLLKPNQTWKLTNRHSLKLRHDNDGTPFTRTIWSVKPHDINHTIKEELSFYRDNPGGDWLKYKQKYAEESHHRWKGLNGASTAEFRGVTLDPNHLKDVRGARGEEAFRHPGNPKYDRLAQDVAESGWRHTHDDAVLIGVNHLGHAYILEGNHRTSYAINNKIPKIHAIVRYFNGGEDAKGLFHPDVVRAFHKEE